MGKYIRWANEDDAESLVTLNAEFNGAGLTESEIKKVYINERTYRSGNHG